MKSLRKLVPAFSLLLVSAVILSSASFAWFTMSREVTAQGMNVTVTAPDNLLIAKLENNAGDTEGWTQKETIELSTNSDLKQRIRLTPASTDSGEAFYVLEENSVANSDTGALIKNNSQLVAGAAATSENKEGAYYDFNYKIKTEGDAEVKVALKSLEITTNTDASIKPVRVAILVKEDQTDVASVQDGMAVPTVETQNIHALYNAGGGTNHNGKVVKATGTITDLVSDSDHFADESYATTNDSNKVFTVPARGNVTLVTIRVWYEGQDTECTIADAIRADFNITAVFAKAE